MLTPWQVPIIETLLALPLLAGAARHNPTGHPAWHPFGPEGAVPGVRAVATDGSAVFALCKKGLVRVSEGKAEVCVGTQHAANAQSLDVTSDCVWLGGPGSVTRMDRGTKAVEPWRAEAPIAEADRVLFDHAGGIYLFDADTHVLSVFDRAGGLRWRVRELYDLPRTLDEPLAVARRANGDLYLADAEMNRILIFTPDGQYKGRVMDNFCRPHGLVVLPKDRLAVLSDYTERIDTPLITILGPDDTAEADWVSDRLVLSLKRPNFISYCISYYQKVGERAKRPRDGYSPLVAGVRVGEDLVIAQAQTGSLRRIPLSAFGASAKYPARRRKALAKKIAAGRASYTIRNEGTLDDRNTKRSNYHSHYTKTPLFQCDDSYTLANTGKVPVVNPHFSINGKGDYFSAAHIRKAILTRPNMTELEKAFAVYNLVSSTINGTNFRASGTGMSSLYYPFEWWGYKKQHIHLTSKWNNFGAPGACGCYSAYVAKLAHDIGLPGRAGGVVAHCPSFVEVDGKEIYLDAILASSRVAPVCGFFSPRIDDQGYANYDDIVRDQYLVMRVVDPIGDKQWAGCYGDTKRHKMNTYDDPPIYVRHVDTSKMAITLRPGEEITRRTAYFGRSCIEPEMQMDATVNGDIVYRPNFADGTYRHGVTEQQAVEAVDGRLVPTSTDAKIAFSMACPHPILTGLVEVHYQRDSSADELEIDVNVASRGWERLWRASRVGRATEMIPLHPLDRMRDNQAQEHQVPPFDYQVRFRMGPSKSMSIGGLAISSIFQTFHPIIPRLEVGENRVDYESETEGPHELTVIHRWKESCFGTEPPPPVAPLFPKDGQTVAGYDFTFEWEPAVDPSGAAIDDYEWQVSKRPDFMWPVVSRFWRYTRGAATQPVPEYSILTHGVKYYWRVRSRNGRGVWGAWSKAWTFQCSGPRVPVGVKLWQEGRRWMLSWKPSPQGTRPVRYEVFGDVEPGFYPVVDKRKTYEANRRKPFFKESNTILTTDKTEAVVVADGQENLDRTFFRVAAIDAAGSRSGPSDFVEAKHPFIFTEPATEARVGREYRYQARSLQSLGHFAVAQDHIYRPEKETVRFALKQGPPWLRVATDTGLLSGTPATAGNYTVALEATNGRDGADTQSFAIKVGR